MTENRHIRKVVKRRPTIEGAGVHLQRVIGWGQPELLISGQPIREPIAWYGPIVMNTQDELRVAFEELERDTFIKHRGAAGGR